MKKLLLMLIIIMFGEKSYSQYSSDTLLNNFVIQWMGVPYKYAGNTKRGIDCSGLTQKFYKDVYNLEIPNTSIKQWKVTNRILKDSLKSGDLVFFKSQRSPTGWHVGIYLNDGLFLHASSRKEDVKISSLNDPYYLRNFKGGGRL